MTEPHNCFLLCVFCKMQLCTVLELQSNQAVAAEKAG